MRWMIIIGIMDFIFLATPVKCATLVLTKFNRAGRHTRNDTDKKITFLFVAGCLLKLLSALSFALFVVGCGLWVGCYRVFGRRPMEIGGWTTASLGRGTTERIHLVFHRIQHCEYVLVIVIKPNNSEARGLRSEVGFAEQEFFRFVQP
jgi:hypothetical protein